MAKALALTGKRHRKELKKKKESNEFWSNVTIALVAIAGGVAAGLAAWVLSKEK
jgi:hypothetical protein